MDSTHYLDRLKRASSFLHERLGPAPRLACLLGSGLGDFVDGLQQRVVVDYSEIPEFPQPTIVGHSGQLSFASHHGTQFAALQGRVHFYEGLSAWDVVFGVRALALWGVERFIVTNAAGAINPDFTPGDLVLIKDHLNLLGGNPLTGPNLDSLGLRFPDLSLAYDEALRRQARECAAELGLTLHEGVYAAVLGPSFETPSEIRMLRAVGADLVGMSTVPEVIALNHMNRQVLGVSCVTNMAAGMVAEPMSHDDGLRVTSSIGDDFGRLILRLVEEVG